MNNYDELKKLAEAATPGPWFHHWQGVYSGTPSRKTACELAGYDKTICEMDDLDLSKKAVKANAKYIAAANPAVIKDLLAELTALRAAASAPKAELTDREILRIAKADANGAYQDADDCGLIAFARAVLAQAAPVAAQKPVARVSHAEEGFADVELLGDVMVGDELYAAAAPAAPVAAAVPAGWVKNTGVQPVADDVLVEVKFRHGRDTGVDPASAWVWDVGASNEWDILEWRLAAPAPGASK